MRSRVLVLAGVLAAGMGSYSAVFGDRAAPAPAGPADPGLVKRGAYLVNEVARCGDCHTPRDGRGRLDMSRHLQGAQMWFTPRSQDEEFEGHAPDITRSGKAGRWSEARMVRLLTTGKESDPPMPAYHLTEDDARAMYAYMASLPGKGGRGGPAVGREDGRRGERGRGRDRERRRHREDD